MARPARNPNDPRSRYAHQAYPISYGGISMERGPSGRETLLGGTSRMAFQFTANAGLTTKQIVGDMPYGVWIDGFILHAALASGTFELILEGVGGGADITLINALTGNLTVAGPTTLTTPVYTPIVNSRPLSMTIVGGPANGLVVASLLATPSESGWK